MKNAAMRVERKIYTTALIEKATNGNTISGPLLWNPTGEKSCAVLLQPSLYNH